MTMFVKEGGVLLLLKKTHTLFFFARLSVAFFFANSCSINSVALSLLYFEVLVLCKTTSPIAPPEYSTSTSNNLTYYYFLYSIIY